MEDFEKKIIRNREIQFRDGDSVNEISGVEYFGSEWFGIYVLPAGTDTENLEAFIRDPASRPMLEMSHGTAAPLPPVSGIPQCRQTQNHPYQSLRSGRQTKGESVHRKLLQRR